MQQRLLVRLRQLGPRHIRIDAELADGGLHLARHLQGASLAKGDHRTLAQGLRRVGDDAARIDPRHDAQAITRGAGTVRAIERKQPRLERRQRDAVLPAHEPLAEHEGLLAVEQVDEQRAIAELERQLDGVGDAPFGWFAHHDTVDDDVQIVAVGLGEATRLRQVDRLSVDASSHETVAA